MTNDAALADSLLCPADALREAVRLIGSQAKAGTILGVTQAAISKRIRKRQRAAAEWVLPLERESGVSRQLLRPDLYRGDERDVPSISPGATSACRHVGLQLGALAR